MSSLRLSVGGLDPRALARVLADWPPARGGLTVEVPLDQARPEEVLARCLEAGLRVRRSEVVPSPG